jgi:O-antigen/teichoic acid export membrane protein
VRELWATVLHTSGARIYTLLTGIFVLFITARLLGSEGRGQVAAITTWVSLFSTFAYLSLGQVAIHRLAQDPGHQRFGQLLGSLATFAVILSAAGWVIALCFYVIDPDGLFKGLPPLALAVGFVALPFLIWEQYGSSLLAGLERIRVYNGFQIAGRTIMVLGIFIMVGGLDWGVVGVLGATILGQVVVAMGGIGVLVRYSSEKSSKICPDASEIRELVAGAAKLHLNAIGSFLITSANVLILNHYRGAAEVGCFQLAAQLVAILMVVPQAASTAIFGKVATLGSDAAWPQNRRMLMQQTLLMVAVGIVAAMFAPWGIPLLAGESFRPAVAQFQWMVPGLIGLTFSSVMAPQWIGRGYFWQAAALTFAIGALNLAANLWLIPSHGVNGAVVTFVVTYIFSMFGNGIMAWHCELKFRGSQRLGLVVMQTAVKPVRRNSV